MKRDSVRKKASGSTAVIRTLATGRPLAWFFMSAPTWNGPSRRDHSKSATHRGQPFTSVQHRHTASGVAAVSAEPSTYHMLTPSRRDLSGRSYLLRGPG